MDTAGDRLGRRRRGQHRGDAGRRDPRLAAGPGPHRRLSIGWGVRLLFSGGVRRVVTWIMVFGSAWVSVVGSLLTIALLRVPERARLRTPSVPRA